MTKNILIAFVLLFIFGCKQKKKDDEKHIDVFGYIKGQLLSFDTIPYKLLYLTGTQSDNLDTSNIEAAQAKQMIKDFLQDAPNEADFEEDFTQTVLGDLSLGSITVTYDCKEKKGTYERIDVYANPENGEITQVYLLKKENPKKQEGKQQLLWTHNQSFLLTKSFSGSNGSDSVFIKKVEWEKE